MVKHWSVVAGVIWTFVTRLGTAKVVAPNHFLGTCLTKDWVASMEKTLNVDSKSRDDLGRLKNPFLHAALQHPIYPVVDPRTARQGAFSKDCVPSKSIIYGSGAVVDETTGVVTDIGVVNNTVVLELNGWTSHSLTSLVFSIIAAEVYGFKVSHYLDGDTRPIPERMSSVGLGFCTPVHMNLEVWDPGAKPSYLMYRNESYVAGLNGYEARSGLYTTVKFVNDMMDKSKHSPPLYADFWKGYVNDEAIITSVPKSSLTNDKRFYPPAANGHYCDDGVFGCKDSCSKTLACETREANGGECMVVAMMMWFYDPAYLQAVIDNIGIPTYFCFIGWGGVQDFALDSSQNNRPVLFYHFEPDLFHVQHPNTFRRVFLPQTIPERVITATGVYGGAYNKSIKNPFDVDLPPLRLVKFAARVLQKQKDAANPIGNLVDKFSLTPLHINDLLRKYTEKAADSSVVDPTFDAACAWIKSNYNEWTKWLDHPSLCQFDLHVHYTLSGCDQDNASDSQRVIEFAWNNPNPDDPTKPYNCDGGEQTLPPALKTSRTCTWITADPSKWRRWIITKPTCDESFYKYNITECDTSTKRTVKYWWLLPDPTDASKSLECTGGETLPSQVLIDCDYMPTNAPGFFAILVIAFIIMGILVISILMIIKYRDRPIIRRSQWEFLLLVVIGGIMMCISALLYAGKPTKAICGARPASAAAAFTVIFGSLFVKSLRVYRVFMKTAFKKATVPATMMAKILLGLVVVDVVIIGVWYAVDFPNPTIKITGARQFRGYIDRISCTSKSFIYSALLMFWKSIVLFMGLYASFLVRNVSTDFQESIWMFASSVIVLIGCFVILPLAYLVDMAPAAFYVFLAGVLLVCTALVMALMLVPKFTRLQVEATSDNSKYTSTNTVPKTSADSRRISGLAIVRPNSNAKVTTEDL